MQTKYYLLYYLSVLKPVTINHNFKQFEFINFLLFIASYKSKHKTDLLSKKEVEFHLD